MSSTCLLWWCNLRPTQREVTVACCYMLPLEIDETWIWATPKKTIVFFFFFFMQCVCLDYSADVSWWSYVCAHKDLAPLAPQDQCHPEALCHLLCPGRFCPSCSCHGQRWAKMKQFNVLWPECFYNSVQVHCFYWGGCLHYLHTSIITVLDYPQFAEGLCQILVPPFRRLRT